MTGKLAVTSICFHICKATFLLLHMNSRLLLSMNDYKHVLQCMLEDHMKDKGMKAFDLRKLIQRQYLTYDS